jgi:CheY-like chemotaxis protein
MTRVLIVDDTSDTVFLLSKMLARLGYEVEAARSGEEALNLARVFRPEVAFVDLWMPKMDGYELAKRLRQLEGLEGVRIIAVSGATPDPARNEASGIDAHLLKPASLNQMLEAMKADGKAPVRRRG